MNWPVLAVAIVTLLFIVFRPRGIGEAWAAAAGGGAMFLLGALGPDDARDVIYETDDVLLFLLGMMVLTWLVEQAGVFDRLAEGVARLARGSGRLLLVLVFGLAAVVTALLSLDVTILLLTPIVHAVAVRRRLDALPYLFACTFVANTGSLLLPVSNLTNLLVYNQLGLDFASFALRMWFPNLVAVAVNLGVFLWIFRERLPRRFTTGGDDLKATDGWLISAALVLAATIAALLVAGLAHAPLAWPALAGGGLLLLIGLATRRVTFPAAARSVSWPLFVFVLGMFFVVRGLEHAWLDRLVVTPPGDPLQALLLAVGVNAVGSNIVNNVPMTLLSLPFIARSEGAVREAFTYGVLTGANIGPSLTTYGSLATMLWLTLIRQRGVSISTGRYMRVALITTPLVLAAATLALWISLR